MNDVMKRVSVTESPKASNERQLVADILEDIGHLRKADLSS